ncbi:type I polyketide synthase [Nevskia sp.]|uniref:type I polyketide synthase n=1 Tax=Nevskia sp. TaxID=1929292 RepID=UPI0025FC697A|nr:type I polyketide synthase [Nevskia sp.]
MLHDSFDVFGIAPADAAHPGVAVAAARAGGTGLLDLEFSRDDDRSAANFLKLSEATDARIGLRIDIAHAALAGRLLAESGARPLTVILTGTPSQQAEVSALLALSGQHRVLAEVIDVTDVGHFTFAHHGLVAKGHEAGGWVGADTSYILAQKLLGKAVTSTSLPIYMQGGIGVHSAAACRAMGAAGVVFEDQLLLLAESPLPETLQNELSRLNGAETRLFGELVDQPCRVYTRPGTATLKAADNDNRLVEAGELSLADWRARLTPMLGWAGGEQLMPVGQGIGMAATYRSQYRSVGRFIQAVRKASLKHIESAVATGFMAPNGALAKSHSTTFPIAQGPMTRVSDSPEFAYQVSKNGALPFLALALMRGPQVLEMLQETKAKMTQGGVELPWGVGMLGFVPHSLREEQIAAVWKCKPTFALIAGGRPDQAAHFEKEGIPTYIHAPAPALLRMYIEQGAKRFVFEGRECGGHIGPLASFPLWEQMIEVLLADVKPGSEGDYHILFAGGIHNAASGAMLAALAAPLAARGMKVGCIMGTAYLFTQEIVDSGAVVKGFRDAAISCDKTVNFETGPGHSTRCVDTPFFREFREARKELLREGATAEELRDRLEDMNMGRMRVASKGLNRDASGQIVTVSEADQYKDGMFMIGQVATMRDDVVTIDALHREVTVDAMTMLESAVGSRKSKAQVAKPSDIAIVGIGTLLPKATNAEKYWENILDQVCVIGEVPKDRWDWKMYFDADRRARDKVYSRWGGFLDEVAFDPISYGIPPKSMKSIDPMQLLTLEVTRRALGDAGMADGDYDRENTSVILGAGGGLGDLGTQYAVRAELPRFVDIDDKTVWERLPEWTEESFAGTLLNVAAGRVTNRMDFGGLNFTIDAACASSLAAISIAVNELEAGRTNVAIAGGIDTVQSPFGFLCFSKTQALSPNGKPRTFDQGADGIAISEGLAVVVLKRLADAEAAGDRIYAVIKSVAGSSDGRALGLTAPRPEGQKLALKRAYERAGFSPATLGMAEAHGTGTPVGDKAEARTITESLAGEGAAPKTVAISSVKTLLGHTKASAGVSGLIKVALSLYHRTLPAHYGVDKPIDTIADPNSPVYLLKDARPWLAHPDHPRRGGVSAFGFGGTNFHAVLEEYKGSFGSASPAGAARWPFELFVFRAKDEATLAADLGRFVSALRIGSNVKFRDLAYSLAKQAEARVGSPLCIALVAKDFTGLLADLEATIASLAGNGKPLPQAVRLGRNLPATAPNVAFLFPGQGSQYVNMGRETALYVDELRGALEFADATLRSEFPTLLSRTILPPATFDADAEAAQNKALTDTRVAQPAIGALALGYTRLASRLGLKAQSVAGHSYGEYAALHAAGALNAADFLALSAVRGRCMAEAAATSEKGAMAAIQARRDVVAAAIAGIAGVKLANHNAPEQAVISGPAAGVEQAAKALEASGVRVTRLAVSGAFHTELVASAQTGLSAAIAAAEVSTPQCTVYSNTTGKPYPTDAAGIKATLDGHLLNSVEFVAEIEAMYVAGARVFVELGPKGTCANMAKATLAGKDAQGSFTCVSLDGQGGGLRGLLLGLAELTAAGVPLALTRLFDGRDPQTLDLNKLADLVKPDAIPKHAWMVSGGCAREQTDATFRTGKLPAYDVQTLAEAQAKLKAARTVIVQALAAAAPAPQAVQAPTAQPALAAANPALGAEALAAYQQTMRQFLQLQERVVSQFLTGGTGAVVPMPAAPALPSVPMPVSVPTPVAGPMAATPPAAPVAMAPARVEAPKPVAAPVSTPVRAAAPTVSFDPTAALLEIVADRTGYPQDMLGLDQDLEAELGIDSIKRVEILGAFQKKLPAAVGDSMQSGMERYTRARTLNAILETAKADLAKLGVGSAGAAPVAVSAPVTSAAAAPAIDRALLTGTLLAIVADRTGYPTDMLGLDQDLEAELGIDSIKRVEILGALQKSLPGSASDAMQGGMERFTRARTLTAILDAAEAIIPAVAVAAPAAVSAAVTSSAPMVSAFDRAAAQATLLSIVADRTGYPTDMLGLDQDLEAELGIDSIKRVEILGALQKALPAAQGDAMQAGMERFTRARTLNAILDAAASLAPASAMAAPAPVAVAEAVAQAAAPTIDRASMQAQLLTIVADRTGYPTDMLGLDQDLEAELGIDSIKRVEILGALQKALPGSQGDAMQAGMEKFTRARTLNAILDAAVSLMPAAAAPVTVAMASTAPPVAAATATIDRASMQAQLLTIVADRTGYPTDMLGLDQDLEAELGIDSIKRVEILGALQKSLPGAHGDAMQAGMEKFTRARTLNAILDAAMAVAAPQQAAVQVTAVAAPATTAAPVTLDRAAIGALLLDIVADRTGYPTDMLGLDQDLEAELGIDSIKRVEILGALQKAMPGAHADAMQAGMEKFTRARSLNAILDAVTSLAVSAATPAASTLAASAAPAAAAVSETIPRYAPRAKRVPLPKQRHAVSGLYVLTADADGVAEKLAARIVAAGAHATVLPASAATDPAQLASQLTALRAAHGKVAGIIHLASLISADVSGIDAWKQQSALQAKSLFWLLQQTMADLASAPSVALAASRFGGSLGREAEGPALPQAGAAVGLFNCATAEIPTLRARLVDFEAAVTVDAIVDALFDELQVAEARTEIGYADGLRYGYTHAAEPVSDNPFAPHLVPGSDWVVLITGGARGITAEVVEEMVKPGMRLVLLGRTPLPGAEQSATASIHDVAALKKALLAAALAAGRKPTPVELERELRAVLADREIRSNVGKLTAAGAVVDYRACDVRDTAAFAALIDAVYAQYGRIDGVLHGAGVIEDKRIPDKTPDSFDRVYDTKVDSAWTLATKLKPESLQLLALFTSVSGRFGNTGQSDYAAANETLNRLAWQLHRRWTGVRVISVNWGPWDAGMASQQVRDAFRARSIEPIPVKAGRRWFVDELAFGPRKDVELVAGAGPWDIDRGSDSADSSGASNDSTGAGVPALPLIRRPLRIGAGGAVVFEHSLSLKADPYLTDHRLDSKPVLPAATALEYMAQFVAAGWPEWQVVEIRDLRAFSGIVLDNDGAEKTLLLRARSSTHSDAGSQAVTVELFDPPRKTPNYRCTALLLPAVPEAPMADASPLAPGQSMEAQQMYADHLFHGPQFQFVKKVTNISADGVEAVVNASSPASLLGAGTQGARWLFDFGLVDTAPQLALVWARLLHGKTALPSSFGKVARYGTDPVVGQLRTVIRIKPATHDAGVRYDMQFIDGKGRVRLAITDAESTMSAALNRLAGNS